MNDTLFFDAQEDTIKPTRYLSGFVALIGPPNTGKSTLLNALMGQKIAITANKPQTTRNQIRGILTTDNYQAIIVDTPGIHTPNNELHRRIVNYALQTLRASDLIIFVCEPKINQTMTESMSAMSLPERLKGITTPVALALNKIDKYSQEEIYKGVELLNKSFPFRDTCPISALRKKGLKHIEALFSKYLLPGERLYVDDRITDQTERQLAAELIREQIFRRLRQEIPYGCAVEIEVFREEQRRIKIYAIVYVNRESHKGIVLGKNGNMLQAISSESRAQIQNMIGARVFLSLHVKINPNWHNKNFDLSRLGYENS